MIKTYMVHGDEGSPVTIEPMRDPNPFHHAAALVQKMDATDLRALKALIADRERELRSENVTVLKPRTALRWTFAAMSGAIIARGKDCTYRLMPFLDAHGDNGFILAAQWHDDKTLTHMKTGWDIDTLKATAEKHNNDRKT